MVLDRVISGSEGPTAGDGAIARQSEQAYQHTHMELSLYKLIFTNTSTPDGGKSDSQCNNELNNPAPIYGPQDTTSGAIGDLQGGIKSDSRTRHDLSNAIDRAIVGDTDGAMQYLRQASGDLNAAGGKIDFGLSKLGDGGQSDGSRTIQRGMANESDCSENIQKAEKLLRNGDTDGAITAMSKGIREVAHRQHLTRDGISSLQSEGPAIDWQNYGPMNPTQSFTPGDSGSYQSYAPGNSSSNQSYAPGGDYSGNYGPMQQPSDSQNGLSLSMNLPNPFDLARDLGLPTPPNPSDIFNSLPNPFDMLNGNGGGGGLPNPFDMISGNGGGGGLPNPFSMFGGGNDSDSGSDDILPNPTKMVGDIMKDPAKPIENLLTPPKSPKDLVKKLLNPFG